MVATDRYAHRIRTAADGMPERLKAAHDRLRHTALKTRMTKHALIAAKHRSTKGGRPIPVAKRETNSSPPESLEYARAPEIVGPPSPQQINAIKVKLSKRLTDTHGPPPYSILWKYSNGSRTNWTNSTNPPDVHGVCLEDAGVKGNPYAVVTTSGLIPLACPVTTAKKFSWGDRVVVQTGIRQNVKTGFDETQEIAHVWRLPPGHDPNANQLQIGTFMGWPTGNPADGGIMVLLKL